MVAVIPAGYVAVPDWFVWFTVAAVMMASAIGTYAVWQRWSFKKYSPEGLVFERARKQGLDVIVEHHPNMSCTWKVGEREKVKKNMKPPNWYNDGEFKFIPEINTKAVEHSIRGLPIVHFVPPHPSAVNSMGVRAIEQLAEKYPELSVGSDKREIAFMFLTLPEEELLYDRPYLIDENPELWERIKEIKKEIMGDGKEGKQGMMLRGGEMVFQNLTDVVQSPETAASEANMRATIEANTRQEMMDRSQDLLMYGMFAMMLMIGAGIAVYIISLII